MTQLFIFSGTTFTIPTDWTSTNKIEGLGSASGGGGGSGNGGGGGGGGGAYATISNIATFTVGQIVSVAIATGGIGGGTGAIGHATTFGSILSAAGASTGGGTASGTPPGGIGGAAANCIPTLGATSGGTGGTGSGSNGGGGGGGAGGPFGAGVVGGAGGSNGGGGGNGDAGHGGVGPPGAAASAPGGAGSEFYPLVGCGGGGSGSNSSTGGLGGNYGAGGGGGGFSGGTGGAGANGILVITYTPTVFKTGGVHNITVVNANFFSLGKTTFLVGPVGKLPTRPLHNIFLYNRDFYNIGSPTTFPVKNPTTGIPVQVGPLTSAVQWFESPLFQPPTNPKTNVKFAALSHPEEGIEGKFIFVPPPVTTVTWGFEALLIPSHTFVEKRGAILRGDDGIERPFIRFFPGGWEIQSWQPPTFLKPNQKTGAWSHPEEGIEAPYVFVPSATQVTWGFEAPLIQPRKVFKGFDQPGNIDAKFIRFFPSGWEIQPPQPPAYPTVKQKYPGTKGKSEFVSYSQFVPGGWEIQSWQPPFYPKTNQKIAAVSHPEEGIEGIYVFVPSTPAIWGWEVQPLQPPHTFIEKRGSILRGIDGIEGKLINFYPYGWDVQPPQPPHPYTEKKGAILRGDDGTEGTFINFLPFGFEVQPPQPPFRINQNRGTILRGDDGTEGIFVNFQPYGWEIPSPQPPHTFFEKKGSILRGIDGIDGIFINFFPYGWEIQPYQPPVYPKTNQKPGAWSQWEDGIESPYVFVPTVQVKWGFDEPFVFPRKIFKDATFRGDDGIEYPFINFLPTGWEIQPPPPPHTFIEKRGSILRGIDGIEAPLIRFFPSGWEIQPYQPPFYPKTNQKIASVSQWEDGIEAPYAFVPPGFVAWAWEIQPWQPPFKVNRIQAFLRGDEGIEAPYINWFNDGWEIQSFQPPHIFVEKRGLILRGDDGVEGKFINFLPSGFEVQPPQPPFFPTIGRKFGALSHPEDGIEGVYVFVATNLNKNPLGWVIQPWQPPHPRPEKSGAWMVGDSGIENIFTFIPPTIRNFEWLTRARRRGRR